MMKIYVLPGNPIPLARPRFTHSKVWDCQKQTKLAFGIMLQQQHEDLPLYQGALHLHIDFYLPIATSHSARKASKLIDSYHFFKPDLSNLIKLVEDCGSGILYKDDCAIAQITAVKKYDLSPRTEFTIREIK